MAETGVINSVTKFRQTDTTIQKMAERAIGHPINMIQIKEMAGGLCNAVYLVEADGTKMVLKVASDPRVKIMRHEKDYVPTEAEILIYKVWQCLGMIVERGFRNYEDPMQYAWVTDIFKKNLGLLKKEAC